MFWIKRDDPSQGLALFARAGLANKHVNRFSAYTGAGAVYTGLFPGRDSDQLGLGFALVHDGEPYIGINAATWRTHREI